MKTENKNAVCVFSKEMCPKGDNFKLEHEMFKIFQINLLLNNVEKNFDHSRKQKLQKKHNRISDK